MKNNLSEKYNKNKKTSLIAVILCFFIVTFTGGGLANIPKFHSLGTKLFFISCFIFSFLIFIWVLSWLVLYKIGSKYEINKKELPKWLIILTKVFDFWDIAFYNKEKKPETISKAYKFILSLLITLIIFSFAALFYLFFKNPQIQNLVIIFAIIIEILFLMSLILMYKIATNYLYNKCHSYMTKDSCLLIFSMRY